MTSPISPISPPAFKPAAPVQTRATEADNAQGGGFTRAVGDALNNVSELENAVTEAGYRAATGDLESVTDYMIASTEAQLATEITVAVRDRAITAFNDIMRMQI